MNRSWLGREERLHREDGMGQRAHRVDGEKYDGLECGCIWADMSEVRLERKQLLRGLAGHVGERCPLG